MISISVPVLIIGSIVLLMAGAFVGAMALASCAIGGRNDSHIPGEKGE